MIDIEPIPGRAGSVAGEVSSSLKLLWSTYAEQPPSEVRTEIRGDTVTCSLIDAVGDFDRAMIGPQSHDTVRGVGKLTLAGYKRDAVAAVTDATRQRVTRLISSHDHDTDVATEIFTLEPSLVREGSQSDTRQLPRRDLRRFGYGQTHSHSGFKG